MVFNSKNVIKAERQALKTVEDTQTRVAEDKEKSTKKKKGTAIKAYHKYKAGTSMLETEGWNKNF